MINVWQKLIDRGAAATTVIQKTDRWTNLALVVDYTGDGDDSAATMTVYGAQDSEAHVKAAIGIQPVLTGTRDADGAIAFATTDTVVMYQIPGVYPYIYIAITGVTADIVLSLWLGGTEDNS